MPEFCFELCHYNIATHWQVAHPFHVQSPPISAAGPSLL